MSTLKQNRKEFLKNAGLALGAIITSGFKTPKGIDIDFNDFPEDQKSFLLEYAGWLKEFNEFIEVQKKDWFDIENNKRLMALTDEAEARKPQLEAYMKDKTFALYYMGITQKLTNEI